MSVELSFNSLFENLKLDDPWLPPKPWESITSESGGPSSSRIATSSTSGFYDISSVSEESLVRIVMYALQGCESALVSIEKLSESFCYDPADRSANQILSLWTRSLSTHALGKMLKSIGYAGSVVLLLHKFVEYFTSMNFDGNSDEKQQDGLQQPQHTEDENVEAQQPRRSLVSQAFAVAVGKVLQGYIGAISTVNASALLRRCGSKVKVLPATSLELGNLTNVVHSELTLLEVYLHTEELRTQIEALGSICRIHEPTCWFSLTSLKDSVNKEVELFSTFPRGGDLLTYLYDQLLVADPAHRALLKFLFQRSLEPYCSFIRSWIYEAKITDPYGEFIIQYEENPTPYSHSKAGMPVDFPFATIRVRDGISTPSFLKDVTIPLLRAGQQLKVVLKLLDLCKYITTGEYTFEDVLPGCGDLQINDLVYAPPLSFNKKEIEDTVNSRKKFYGLMLEKLDHVMRNFEIKYHQVTLHHEVRDIIHTGGCIDPQSSFTFDEILISSAGTGNLNGTPEGEDSDTSSMTDELSHPLESSEYSSEDHDDCMQSPELLEGPSTANPNHLSSLRFSSISIVDGCTKDSSRTDRPCHVSHDLDLLDNVGTSEVSAPQLDHCWNQKISNDDPESCSELSSFSKPWIAKMQYADQGPGMGWPLGSLTENPLEKWMCNVDARLHNSGSHQHTSMRDFDISEDSCITNAKPDCSLGAEYNLYEAKKSSSPSSYTLQSWNAKTSSNLLSMNPMLTRNNFHNHVRKAGNVETPKSSKIFPYFEFSYVEDPLKVRTRWEAAIPEDRSRTMGSVVLVVKPRDGFPLKQYSQIDDATNKETVLKVSADDTLSSKEATAQSIDSNLKNARGGGDWESLMHNRLQSINQTKPNHGCTSEALFEMPLDFVISKCIVQEVLYQYNYVSKLTIKLLEEGFDLQEHLLTLRRYYFMEISDWADLFIRSLSHHKLYYMEAGQGIAEIQGLLKSSIQRSSCEHDLNKDRLYTYVKDSTVISFPSSVTGVKSFNFVGLGYRVEWPISIILNPSALRIYAEIFSFLIQVKLAVQSLTDLWCLMKDIGHIYNHHSNQHGKVLSHFTLLAKLRHQVHHFVSALQQYVLSLLSDVSWCRFIYSLKYQVKDMLDLELVHKSYLSNCLRICFLSDESKSTSDIIQGILQCALDFHSCVVKDTKEADQKSCSSNLFQIDKSQLLSIKRRFDESMRDLHSQFLKSPKHTEFGLPQFWSHLNYNDYYYSEATITAIPHYALPL